MKIEQIPEAYADTSSFSYHVDDDWYAELDHFRSLFAEDWPAAPITDVHAAHSFLTREARLIDDGRFNDWLELFAGDGLYWIPVTAGGGDPRREVSHAFDDHRRLTDRVYWLRTGLAYSQLPPSRTRRLIGNVETFEDLDGTRLIRSNFVIHEFRAGIAKTYVGWYGHVVRDLGSGVGADRDTADRDTADGNGSGGWRIRMKMVNLIDSDQYHENLTLVF